MARIIVTTDQSIPSADARVLLDESVYSVHLSTDHAALQLLERLGWALNDAEELERVQSDRRRLDPARSPRSYPARTDRRRITTRQAIST
jgi:hypothetical protein